MRRPPCPCPPRPGSAVAVAVHPLLDLPEGETLVRVRLLRQAEGALTDDVALDLIGAAVDRRRGGEHDGFGVTPVARAVGIPSNVASGPMISQPISAESLAMRVWASLPTLASPAPRPRAASVTDRLAVHSPVREHSTNRASFWRIERVVGSARYRRASSKSSSIVSTRARAGRRRAPRGVASPELQEPALGAGRREVAHGPAGADPDALEHERGVRDRPAVVQPADQVGVGDHRVVEEHLVEQRMAGDLDQRADGHAGLVDPEREPGDPRVLRGRRRRCGRAASRSRRPWPPSSRPSGPRSPSGRRRASPRVDRPARSEPDPGSLKSWHQATEPS